MPFLGGRRIASVYGDRYTDWLTEIYGGTGDTDYVGYFFHRAAELMTPSGTMGFIATNSIAEGDNRRTVLARMVEEEPPFEIYAATTGVPWPGSAQVLVSTIHLARDLPAHSTSKKLLDGRPCRQSTRVFVSETSGPSQRRCRRMPGWRWWGASCAARGSCCRQLKLGSSWRRTRRKRRWSGHFLSGMT